MFKVGDRVRIKIGAVDVDLLLHVPEMRYLEGCLGTIKEIGALSGNCRVQADGDEEYWWWKPCALEPVDYPVCIPKPTWRIIIEGDENTSRAKYIVGKKVIKEASAKRHPDDRHSISVATRVLVDRLFGDTAKPDDPPKYFTGKVVCVEADTCMFEKGRIYDFSLNGGRGYNYLTCNTILGSPAKSVEEINQRLVSKFMEIKED